MCNYLSGDGHDNMMKSRKVVRVTHLPPTPRHIDVKPRPLGHAHLVGRSILRGRKECAVVIAMERDVEDAGDRESILACFLHCRPIFLLSSSSSSPVIVLKDMLRPIAVVNIPVQDEDSQLGIVGDFLGIVSSESCRVEQTEATGLVSLSMMTRRTDDGHGVGHLQRERTNQLPSACQPHIINITAISE